MISHGLMEIFVFQGSGKELLSTAAEVIRSKEEHGANSIPDEERTNSYCDDGISDQVPTLAIHERTPMHTASDRLATNHDGPASNSTVLRESSRLREQEEMLNNGESGSSELRSKGILSKRIDGKGASTHLESDSFAFGLNSQEYTHRKVKPNQ